MLRKNLRATLQSEDPSQFEIGTYGQAQFIRLATSHKEHRGCTIRDLACISTSGLSSSPLRERTLDLAKSLLRGAVSYPVIMVHNNFLLSARLFVDTAYSPWYNFLREGTS